MVGLTCTSRIGVSVSISWGMVNETRADVTSPPSRMTPDWATSFGDPYVNTGSETSIASASTLVAVTIIHKYELPLTFGGFVRKAVPYAAVQLVLATAYVLLVLR